MLHDPQAGSVPKAKILVVDDNALVTSLIKHKLEKEGFEVLVFHDGAKALKAAQAVEVSLCIIDVRMPEMGGFELLTALRSLPAYADVPIMLATAVDGDAPLARGMNLGADEYIVKPFSVEDLLGRVRRLLKKRHQGSDV